MTKQKQTQEHKIDRYDFIDKANDEAVGLGFRGLLNKWPKFL